MKERQKDKFTQTYVYRDNGESYFVSTAYRESSAELNPDGWYFETLAWTLNDKNERLDIIADNSGAIDEPSALKQHFQVVEQLHEKGRFFVEDVKQVFCEEV
jgi:hypothetical protein